MNILHSQNREQVYSFIELLKLHLQDVYSFIFCFGLTAAYAKQAL